MANLERRAKKKAISSTRSTTRGKATAESESEKQKLLLDQLSKVESLEEGKMKTRTKLKRGVEVQAKVANEGRVALAKKASSDMLTLIHRESKQKADKGKADAEMHMEKTAKLDASRAAQITATIHARDSGVHAGRISALKLSEVDLAKKEKSLESRMADTMSRMASTKETMAQVKVSMLKLREGSASYELADAQMQRLSLRHSTLSQDMFRMEHRMTGEEDEMSDLETNIDHLQIGRKPNPRSARGDGEGWLQPEGRRRAAAGGWGSPDDAAAKEERHDKGKGGEAYPNAPQYHMPPVTNGGVCHVTMAGRPSSIEALARYPVKCTPDHAMAAVRCCSDTGPSMTPRGCYTASFESAKARCDEIDARLCAKDELDSARGTGCDFDAARVWTSTSGKLEPATGTDGVNEIVPRLDRAGHGDNEEGKDGSEKHGGAGGAQDPTPPSGIARAVKGVGTAVQTPAFLIVMIALLVVCLCCCGLLLFRSSLSYAKVGFEDRNEDGDYGDKYKYSQVQLDQQERLPDRRLSGDFYADHGRRGLI